MSEYIQRRGKPVVLWVGECKPLEAELAELKEILGDFTLVKRKIHSTRKIVNTAIKLEAKVVIPFLPIKSVAELFRLCKRWGIEVWQSRMEKIRSIRRRPMVIFPWEDYNPSTDRVVPETGILRRIFRRESYAIYRFNGFDRVVEVEHKKANFKIWSITICRIYMQKAKWTFWWVKLPNESQSC